MGAGVQRLWRLDPVLFEFSQGAGELYFKYAGDAGGHKADGRPPWLVEEFFRSISTGGKRSLAGILKHGKPH